jgi:chloramphenicol 3-O-phosphotransferase
MLNALAWCFPPPAGDRFQQRLALRNLKAVWSNARVAGATHLILARVVESRAEIEDYRRAIPGAEIQLVRLRAELTTLRERIKQRRGEQDQFWHLARAAELAPVMDESCVEDHLVDTDGRSPAEIAAEILVKCGWSRSHA